MEKETERCPRLAPEAQAVTAPISGEGGPRERKAPGATPPSRAAFTCRGRRSSDSRDSDSAGTRAAAGPLPWPRRRSCTPRARSHRHPVPGPAATGTPTGAPHRRQAGYLAWGHFSPPPPGRRAQCACARDLETGASAEPPRFSLRTLFPRGHRGTTAYGARDGPTALRLEKAVLLGASRRLPPRLFRLSHRLSCRARFSGKDYYFTLMLLQKCFIFREIHRMDFAGNFKIIKLNQVRITRTNGQTDLLKLTC
ncbi:uncharacterized protein LOC125101228 [Lutra lutra]|uniref:uncharacterized protein LOC125101228 n=1 Tax=Lutra lutra TaxID=9657 RepID=UPI001FCFCAA7|nr:uncharacterized protein LOC125101228 [Lutra lutra]